MLASLGRQGLGAAAASSAASSSRSAIFASTSLHRQDCLSRKQLARCSASVQPRRGLITSLARSAESMPPTESTPENAEALNSMEEVDRTEAPSELGTDANEEDAAGGPGRQGGFDGLPPYSQWIEGEGKNQYGKPPPGQGPFWIGHTPFPLNPSFNPPPPLAYSVKVAMRDLHWRDPQKNSVHKLSTRFQVPIERVVAILRLMALEVEEKKKGNPLQSVFQKEMDRLLGAVTRSDRILREGAELPSRRGNSSVVPREEIGMSDAEADKPSVITPVLAKEVKERSANMRSLPTGGPSSRGPTLQQRTATPTNGRAPMTYVDMSPRPTSYRGAGVAARNKARAARRSRTRARVTAKRAARKAHAPSAAAQTKSV